MRKYKAFVLAHSQSLRELIVECLNFSDFDACGYSEAERLLGDLFDPSCRQMQPDLLVVDLELEANKMQGIQFLSALVDRDISSEILAITGPWPVAGLEKAIKMGLVAVMTKPFNIYEAIKKMKVLAETGKKRRQYRLQSRNQQVGADATRLVRPVFLSYANDNKDLAMGIRRNLEALEIPVWYAPDTIELGDPWRQLIEEGIEKANIFVAIITDSYIASRFCLAELSGFYSRMEFATKPHRVILPVLVGASEACKKHDLVWPILEKFHYIDISTHFLDELTALLGRIQRIVGQQVYGDFLSRVS
jgi:FixJ family two-component response regulator